MLNSFLQDPATLTHRFQQETQRREANYPITHTGAGQNNLDSTQKRRHSKALAPSQSSVNVLAISSSDPAPVPHFKPLQFFKDAAFHFLGPLVYPLCYHTEHIWGMRNRFFLPPSFKYGNNMAKSFGFVFQTIIFVSHYLATITFLFFNPPGITWWDFGFMQGWYFMRICVIGIKYAFFSEKSLAEMRIKPELGKIHINQQIISGWIFKPAKNIWDQIRESGQRNSVDVDSTHLLFFGTASSVRKSLSHAARIRKVLKKPPMELKSTTPLDDILEVPSIIAENNSTTEVMPGNMMNNNTQASQHIKVSILDFLLQLQGDVANYVQKKAYISELFIATYIVSIAACSIPIIYVSFFFADGVHQNNSATVIFLVTSFLVNMLSMSSNMQFIVGAISDYSRREAVRQELSNLLTNKGYVPLTKPKPLTPITTNAATPNVTIPNDDTQLLDIPSSTTVIDIESADGNPQSIPADSTDQNDESTPALHFELTSPANITLWLALRNLVRDYGIIFSHRIQFFIGMFVLFLVFASLYLVYTLVFEDTLSWVAILQVLAMYPLFGFLLFLAVLPAGKLNTAVHRDMSRIARCQLMIRSLLAFEFSFASKCQQHRYLYSVGAPGSNSGSNSGLGPESANCPNSGKSTPSPNTSPEESVESEEDCYVVPSLLTAAEKHQLSLCDSLYGSLIPAIKSDDLEYPTKLLGVKVTGNLTQSILTITASGIFVALRMAYLRN